MIAFINSKKGEGEEYCAGVYNVIQINLFVCEFKIFRPLSLLGRVLHCHGTCTTSYHYQTTI